MTAVLTAVPVAPLLAAPSLRAEQLSQLVLGEGASVVAREGEHLEVVTALDSYRGWVHQGYVRQVPPGDLDRWLSTAGWSEGAVLEVAGSALRAPHRARLPASGSNSVRLPDGRSATIRSGSIRPWGEVIADCQQVAPHEWAWREFAGTPYLWGGVTSAGIDCSGLVQTTFLARGVPLPRDARDQVSVGEVVELGAILAGDLLYFHGEGSDAITHVAIAASADTIVHSTIATGMVSRESWTPGCRAAPLRARLVAARRLA